MPVLFHNNPKTVNNIYYQYVLNGRDSINTSDSTELISIAQQCPKAGGVAVYRARSFLKLLKISCLYDDNFACAASSSRFSNIKQQKNNFYVSLMGNPYSDLSYFTGNKSLPSDGIFRIYDSTGKLIDDISLVKDQIQWNIKNVMLHSGLYNYQLTLEDGDISSGKFMVTK